MPYAKVTDLPTSVQHALPKEAQKIYMKVYNSAHEEYKNPSKRRDDATLEETCSRVAWAAVKKKFQKGPSGRWTHI